MIALPPYWPLVAIVAILAVWGLNEYFRRPRY